MDTKSRMLVLFLLLVNTVLVVAVCSLLVRLQGEVQGLNETLATKTDLQAMRVSGFEWPHETQCTRCHTERRFAGLHGTEGELLGVIKRMQQLPDSKIQPSDVDRLHASLELLKCTRCHSTEKLDRMSLLTEAQQGDVIRQMQQKPQSGISPGDVERIRHAFHVLLGF